MYTKCKLNLVSWLLIICLTLCELTATQMNNDGDPCDVGTYTGTCLSASKCFELSAIMKEMGLTSNGLGHCGFTVTEEIICCPKRQTTAAPPNQLSNKFIGLLRPFEFRTTPEDETTTKPVQAFAADNFFSNFFKEANTNNNAQNGNDSADPVPGGNELQKNDQRLNEIFSGNMNGDNNQRITNAFIGNNIPFMNNGIFNGRAFKNGDINDDNAQRINNIFNEKPVQTGYTIGVNTQGIFPVQTGNKIEDNAQRINIINGIFGAKNKGNSPNDENAERINAIFNAGEPQVADNRDVNGQKINDIMGDATTKVLWNNPFHNYLKQR